MIILIADRLSPWGHGLTRALTARGVDWGLWSLKEWMRSAWCITLNEGIPVRARADLMRLDSAHACCAIIGACPWGQVGIASFDGRDDAYYRHAWMSVWMVIQTMGVPMFNPIDLNGVGLQWQGVLTHAVRLGFLCVGLDMRFSLCAAARAFERAWFYFYTQHHIDFETILRLWAHHVPQGGQWVCVHRLEDRYYVSAQTTQGPVWYHLSRDVIHNVLAVLDHVQSRLGMALLYVLDQVYFIACTPRGHWHLCWADDRSVQNAFVSHLVQLPDTALSLYPGPAQVPRGLTIPSEFRPIISCVM